MFKIEKNFREETPFKVESHIPLPARKVLQPKKRESLFPFEKMSVGDSFLIPTGFRKMNSISGTCSYHSKKLAPKKFVSRTTKAGIRVWRVA